MTTLGDVIGSIIELTLSFSYAGNFLLSLVSNLIIFIPVPYLLLVFLLGSHSGTNLVLLSFISGLGAACGKLIIFTISRSGRRFIDPKFLRNLEFAKLIMERYGFWAVFIVAATPLPDDIFYIPLGIAKFAFIQFFFACLAGKFLLALVVALGGRYSIAWIERFVHPESLLGAIITVLFIAGSIYATIRIDWEAIFVKYFLKKEKKSPEKE